MKFADVLTIVFVVLKLTGVIGWSWWLVLLPEIIVSVIRFVVCFCKEYQKERFKRKYKFLFKDFRR